MIYIIIFLASNAIGVLAGYLIASHILRDDITGFLHLIQNEGEESYIFLELKNDDELEKIADSKFVTLEVIHSHSQ